ncbi:hypothetical protein K2Z83_19580 [Oscillochloris sp. ZM17-4]|uniref:prenyltransferase/squalene oxidase repeat-containing protein n=1 Tax=Oscillochloris sp. ZM17-4 TaxID=2866714 RepID=UPI001C736D15|nr:prenyltransferase/squalene oxidase repeat-containing protein [Oscillochloris sp. ZM17-4]MBX0329869.1 hypothetical protein [Oscillochloris sp. ZM17-4]
MDALTEIILTDLRYLIADLGADGGLTSPAIYDTAQVIRHSPPEEGVWPAIDWLLSQQHADGGWGSPAMPMARDVPTLAAILALNTHCTRRDARNAIQHGLAFIRLQAHHWSGEVPNDIPIATEMILPKLLQEAASVGLEISSASVYTPLRNIGARRAKLIAQLNPQGGTTASHSWEAWGTKPDIGMLDESGGVGHSPAATAAWIAAATDDPHLAPQRAAAHAFLVRAEAATGLSIPGIVPVVWPYPRNEQVVSLFGLFLGGLFDEPALHTPLSEQIADLWRSLRPEGQGISDWFTADGDITAMSLAITRAGGYCPDSAVLQRYIVGGRCLTYRQELQHSLSATAHAAHALAILGGDPHPLLNYLCDQRTADGIWMGDKWHTSWTYITGHTISALLAAGRYEEAHMALPALLDHQHSDGSWGVHAASDEETAYITIALLDMDRHNLLDDSAKPALLRASRWLQINYHPFIDPPGECWIGKELYRPRRIARALYLSAMLGCVRRGYTL